MLRRSAAALALLAVLPLAACSSSKPSAQTVDYGKAETAAATSYVQDAAPLKGSTPKTSLEFVKAYCDGVTKQGVKAQNRDDLLITTSATVEAWQKAALLYCPVTMRLAG